MQRTLTIILALLGMVGALAIDAYLPSIPAIGREFEVGPLAMQQTLSLFLSTFAFMMLFYGTLSDSFGRRPVILVSLVIYTLASLGAVFAPTFGWLLACRVLQGLSAGAGSVVGQAIVQDRFSHDQSQAQRIMSHVMMVFGLAPAIAPILGGWLHVTFGWRSTFIFLTVFGALLIALVYRMLPESLPKEQRHAFHGAQIAKNYLMVLKNPQFLLLSLAVGSGIGGLSLYIGSAATFVIDILHLSETSFGWLFIPIVSGMVIGSGWATKQAGKIEPDRLVWIGFGAMAAAAAANIGYNAVFAAAVPWAVLPMMAYTFGVAVAMPAIQISALALFPENRGLASSLLSFIQMIAFALVSGLLAPVLFGSALHLACGLLAAVAGSFVCWRLSMRAQAPVPVMQE